MTEKYILGQRALANSKSKINGLLYRDYEKFGEPSPENISRLIPMGIGTVKKHIKEFRLQINKIYQLEQEKLASIEAKKQVVINAYEEHRKKKIEDEKKNNKDEWGF